MSKYREVESGDVVEAKQVAGDDPTNVKTKAGSVDAAPGTWVLTHSDGSVSLCHDSVFTNAYKKER